MSDEYTSIFEAPVDRIVDADELVRATMAWHFSPTTGSPYWTRRAKTFGFDPVNDVRSFADLRLFDDVEMRWDRIPAHELVPKACAAQRSSFGIFESGGTTGPPKRIVDSSSRRRNVEWQSRLLDQQGFPSREGNWLHVGPTGPHIMAKNVTSLAAMRGFMCCYVDLDPRWAKRCVRKGRQDLLRDYVDHILDQVKDVLSTQDIRAMSSTPPMLEAMATRPDVHALIREKVRGIIWGGTSLDAETLRLFIEEVYPEATIAGAYGNTMMGVAPQRPRAGDDHAPCVFRPFYPYSQVEIVDPANPAKPVQENADGRVKITVLTRDLFVPPTLERDQATRRACPDGYPGIDLSDVRPAASSGDGDGVTEGVY